MHLISATHCGSSADGKVETMPRAVEEGPHPSTPLMWWCPICLWPKSRVRNNKQQAAACFLRLLDNNPPPEDFKNTGTGTRIGGLERPGVWLAFLPSFWGRCCLSFRPLSNCKTLVEVMSNFQVRPPRERPLKHRLCTLLQSAERGRAGLESTSRPEYPSQRKCGQTVQKHPGADAEHASTVESGIA